MSDTKTFLLPDLGEGLPDATIVEWFVGEGDTILLDAPLVSMETAKAVVEVPSPVSGTVLKLGGNAGDIVATGSMLAVFAPDPALPQRGEGHDSGHRHGAAASTAAGPASPATATQDAGTVVGSMQVSDTVRSERLVSAGGARAMPAVRAMARKLGLDLSRIRASGPDGTVTMADVKQAAAEGSTAEDTPPSMSLIQI
ncbi:hypothetical protein CSC70_12760 [Pseudoxanthomonas kalamensis DSM 18571]|nr:hypothetical protein CSC70_12760 [Pseudoxanthomonas kalamensis DSM 18571]